MTRSLVALSLLLTACSSTSLIGEADDTGADASLAPDAGPDDGCPAWLVPCGSECVDAFSDNAHCGACNRPCAAGTGCADGRCLPSVPTGPPPARCAAGGPPITIGGGDAPLCADALALATFTRALCVCRELVPGPLLVEGSVGAGMLSTGGAVEITGALELTASLLARAETRASSLRAEAISLEGALTIDGDAFVERFGDGAGTAIVGGTLHTELACASVPPGVRASACVTESVELEPPCRCEDLAIGDVVERYSDPLLHDNDEVGLAPDVLAGPGASGRVDLACGHYYLTRVAAGGPITVAIHGPTALYVAGSILADAPIAFVVDPSATLDLFVGGTILARAPLRIGSPDRPAATRMWVGGACAEGGAECRSDADCCSERCASGRCDGGPEDAWAVRLGPTSEVAALIAAPEAPLVAGSALEVRGAILSRDYRASARTAVRFDRAALDASACPAPPSCAGAPECGRELGCSDGRSCLGGCCVELGE